MTSTGRQSAIVAPRARFTTLPAIGLAGALAMMAACKSEIRFDDHSIDAPAPPAAVDTNPPEVAATNACSAIRCGYQTETCTATVCELECPANGQCSGSCGPGCTTDCEEDSECSLTTGNDGWVRCEARARCRFTLGPQGEARCDPGSRCDVQCLGVCGLLCVKGATCAFSCSPSAALVGFSGRVSCP